MDNVAGAGVELFGIPLFSPAVWELIFRFGYNIMVVFILIRFIYYRYTRSASYAFTYFMFNTVIFFVCYLLSNVTLSIGFAFGLFAVFAILRYRTDPIPIKEMTYLFIVITIGVMNALSTPGISYAELLFANVAILILTLAVETYWHGRGLQEADIIYEKVENIKPANHEAMLADLRERTGLDIKRYKITRTDFLRDTARIRVFYIGEKQD